MLAVAATAVGAFSAGAAPPTARGVAAVAGPEALITRLAVLRRPATSADVLPHGLRIPDPHRWIIPSLTRLVALEPGVRIFVVVSTPADGRRSLWSASLGDQVALVSVTAQGATESQAVPAADLSNADQRAVVGGRAARPPAAGHAYNVSVAPDGVARQAIRFDARHSYRASLLADFAVFAVHSRSGVRTPAGDIISRPRLSSVPLPILDITAPNQPPQLDPEQMREVRTPSGDRSWIIPGARGAPTPRAATGLTLGNAAAATARPDSGLRGQVLYGPTCPVQRPGDPCERPFQATIVVTRSAARGVVARVHTSADGRFTVRLRAGHYLVTATSATGYPRPWSEVVAVAADHFTGLTIRFDSGIR